MLMLLMFGFEKEDDGSISWFRDVSDNEVHFQGPKWGFTRFFVVVGFELLNSGLCLVGRFLIWYSCYSILLLFSIPFCYAFVVIFVICIHVFVWLKVDLDLNIGSKALEIHEERVEEEDEYLIVFFFFFKRWNEFSSFWSWYHTQTCDMAKINDTSSLLMPHHHRYKSLTIWINLTTIINNKGVFNNFS